MLVEHGAVLATDVEAARDRVVGEPPAGIEALAEPAEAREVDHAAQLGVDDQQQQRVGPDVDDGCIHRPSCFATITFMISFVPA